MEKEFFLPTLSPGRREFGKSNFCIQVLPRGSGGSCPGNDG
ncbi:MAG: hypothetical protein ACQERU_10010 [Bacteroidota bacterium]